MRRGRVLRLALPPLHAEEQNRTRPPFFWQADILQRTRILPLFQAAIAQLGERQTEDLKVPGSIPGLGIDGHL